MGSEVKAFETNRLFTYVAGDASSCYRSDKCRLVTRQLVFLMPNHFVIFDRVVSTKPEYRKDWLIHPGSEPVFDGATFRSEHLDGRMFCRTLVPTNPQIRIVGGPGNEFRTGDVNWDIYRGEPGSENALTPENLRMMGQWRVEVSPPEAETTNVFLHVIEVGDKSLDRMVDTERVLAGDRVGVRLTANGRTYEATFATSGAMAGHIRITGEGGMDRHLTREVTPQVGILAAPE